MQRITQKQLEALAERINQVAGTPTASYTEKDGKLTANVGNYHINYAYGGCKLVQMFNKYGGIRAITSGYIPKRELWYQMHAFLSGLEAGKGE